MNQVLSSLVDQEVGHQVENHNLGSDELHRTYTVEEFEVRILEPEKSGGPWQTKATIPMQSSENALTVRVVTLLVSLFLSHPTDSFSLHTFALLVSGERWIGYFGVCLTMSLIFGLENLVLLV